MAKGYIVVDMPESCKDCKFRHIYDAPYCVSCAIAGMTHEGYDKPDWCPIKEILKKLTLKEVNGNFDFLDGYNELIDEMLGDET